MAKTITLWSSDGKILRTWYGCDYIEYRPDLNFLQFWQNGEQREIIIGSGIVTLEKEGE